MQTFNNVRLRLIFLCNFFVLGIGTGLAIAAAFVALNAYFDKKRGQAVSFSSAGTALAMMLVPQVNSTSTPHNY